MDCHHTVLHTHLEKVTQYIKIQRKKKKTQYQQNLMRKQRQEPFKTQKRKIKRKTNTKEGFYATIENLTPKKRISTPEEESNAK